MSVLDYVKTNWQNNVTPLNQTNMLNIEDGIVGVVNHINNNVPFTRSDYVRLMTVEANAQSPNIAKSVLTDRVRLAVSHDGTTYIDLYKSDLGLGNVDNTHDSVKHVALADSATEATHATSADSATASTKATKDADGNVISSTYLKKSAITDKSTATALSSTNTSPVSERSIYFGTPTINGSKSYTSNTTIYAPTSAGTNGQVLSSNGSGCAWVNQSTLSVASASSATKATQDADGNVISSTYLKKSAITDKTTATAISSTNTSPVTERAIYYGLPTINGSKAYTSATNIYAPSSAGTSGQILVSSGGTPSWTNTSSISIGTATKASQDADGNVISSTYVKSSRITDRTSATTLGTSTNLLTERAIYYAIPTINGSKSYTSNTSIYAPTSTGTSGQVLTSSGSGCSWSNTSALSVGSATKATQDASGNVITSTYSTKSNTIRSITFNSGGTVSIVNDDGTTSSQTVYAVVNPIYVGTSAPSNTVQIWIHTTTGVAKYYNGSEWTPLKASW